MDEFWTPFSIPKTTTAPIWVSHSQQNMDHSQNVLFSCNCNEPLHFTPPWVSYSQQNMDHSQNVLPFSCNCNEPPHFNPIIPSPPMLYLPPPHIAPYEQNSGPPFMHMDQPLGEYYPMYSVPVEQSNVTKQTYEPYHQGLFQAREENMVMYDAAKIARLRRIQARQRIRNGSTTVVVPSVPEETIIRPQPQVTHDFYGPNGKMLTKFMTKKLRNSDVGNIGRIVIPKKGAEEILPTLRNKEGTNIILQDVYSGLKWCFKYKYWSNNKSHRMYVLDNTVDFVNHYDLRAGDSITLYKDEFRNLYVSTKKEENVEEAEDSSSIKGKQTNGTYNYMHTGTKQAIDEEEEASFTLLLNEFGHNRDQEVTNNIFTIYNDGGSSTSLF